ncbi:MAG: ADP-ribosylglycohydrolase family protein [Herpetosiphonaceae bacterium]|nr:ADP-ribosylglycohydrolase family protein [Herpetosiphonaceae bacterium]
MSLQDRFRGVIAGLAVGDALGGPVEFMSPQEIITKRGKPVREMIGGGWLKLKPGETTDDTAMARALAESVVALGDFDCDDVARRYVLWLKTGPKDIGNITRRALEAWQKGVTLPHAAAAAHRLTGGKSAGNGSIMRCAPLALRYAWDERRLIDSSRDDALITHFDPEAGSGSMAVNLLIAHLLRDEPLGQALATVAGRLRGMPRTAAHVADLFEQVDPQADSRTLPNSGYVLDTIRIVLWALKGNSSFEEAVVAAVNCGGDADTQGAVAGALAGARWGYAAIPQRWLEPLQDRDRLLTLADRLLSLAEHKRIV